MLKVVEILKNSPAIYLATVNNENAPNNRPVALALEEKRILYFSTSNETSMYNDLQKNPLLSISVMTPEFVWVRINAKCKFTDDTYIKEKILQEKEFLKNTFENSQNPKFKVFFLESGTATIYDYSGNPPKEYTI